MKIQLPLIESNKLIDSNEMKGKIAAQKPRQARRKKNQNRIKIHVRQEYDIIRH